MHRFIKSTLTVISIVLRFIWPVLVIALIIWSFMGLGLDLSRFQVGVSKGSTYLLSMFPQKKDLPYIFSLRHTLLEPFLDTIQMAVVGTVVGAIVALPVSFFAARTTILPRWLTGSIKSFLNLSRAVPTMIYALFMISAVGLGKSAGAMTIALVSFISLAKLYSEALESVSPGPIEAVRAVGGNSTQVFVYGMLPQVFPHYVATTLYSFEYNLKDSFIVGIVGAGGLGYQLLQSMQFFKWLDAGVIITLLIILVNLVDYGSYRLRLIMS